MRGDDTDGDAAKIRATITGTTQMHIDLFFGLPKQRIIRSRELIAYHKFELGRPKFSRAKSADDLPAPLRPVIRALQTERPHTPGNGALAPGQARYELHKTSFTVSLEVDQGEPFQTDPSLLTLVNEILYCNVTIGGWVCAMKPGHDAQELAAFTSERCITKYISKDDRATLLDRDWFIKGRFFCIAPRQEQFMQMLNQGGGYVIEFRAGPGRPIHRTYESEFTRVDSFLDGYLSGHNMNASDYRFAPLTGPDLVPGLLPARDAEGRWVPERESILASAK